MVAGALVRIGVPLALAALELAHPTWQDGSVSDGVRAAGAVWIPLHVALTAGYLALVAILWRLARGAAVRGALVLFGVCNTAFLLTDGVAVGYLANGNATTADALWNSAPLGILAEATGAAWAAALLLLAIGQDRLQRAGALLTWLSLLVGATAPARLLALATAAWSVYQRGTLAVASAFLVVASVLRQHVGPEAALGLVFVALALAATGRSAPAAGSPPSTGSRRSAWPCRSPRRRWRRSQP